MDSYKNEIIRFPSIQTNYNDLQENTNNNEHQEYHNLQQNTFNNANSTTFDYDFDCENEDYNLDCDISFTFQDSLNTDSPAAQYIRSQSPNINNTIDSFSLLNLSISPIMSPIAKQNSLHSINNSQNQLDESMSEGNNYAVGEDNIDARELEDHISLEEIKRMLSPIENNNSNNAENKRKKRLNLDTIYEGVFLETPPRHGISKTMFKDLTNDNAINANENINLNCNNNNSVKNKDSNKNEMLQYIKCPQKLIFDKES